MSQKPTAPPPAVSNPALAAPPPPVGKSARATLVPAINPTWGNGLVTGRDRIVIYGPGKVGKSTLAAWLPGAYGIDIEDGLKKIPCQKMSCGSFMDLRGMIQGVIANPPPDMRTLFVDSGTKAETLAAERVIETKRNSKGERVDSLEGFGWNAGRKFVYEEFLALLADLDRVTVAGYNVALIGHSLASPAPNPEGDEYLRYEPSFYGGDKRGDYSIRDAVVQWAEHLLFVNFDVATKDGRGVGGGTRTIFTCPTATAIAGSRAKQTTIPFEAKDPGRIWKELEIV